MGHFSEVGAFLAEKYVLFWQKKWCISSWTEKKTFETFWRAEKTALDEKTRFRKFQGGQKMFWGVSWGSKFLKVEVLLGRSAQNRFGWKVPLKWSWDEVPCFFLLGGEVPTSPNNYADPAVLQPY